MSLESQLARLEKAAPARRSDDGVALRVLCIEDPDEQRSAFLALSPLERSNDLFRIMDDDEMRLAFLASGPTL